MAIFGFKDKKVSVAQTSDSGSSQDLRDHHVFKDPVTAQYWREVYDTAQYEGRHRFDPDYTWTADEEKRLVRKVRDSYSNSTRS